MPYWQALGGDYLRARGIEPGARLSWLDQAMTMNEAVVLMIRVFGLKETPAQVIHEMENIMAEHYRLDVPLKPGVLGYLNGLRARGCRLCVATATAVPLATACLERLGVMGMLDFLLSCESIGVSKKRPDIYLLAAERFGARPEDCAVFEDALFAARTAREAGFYTVGVFEPTLARDWDALSALADETVADWTRTPQTI